MQESFHRLGSRKTKKQNKNNTTKTTNHTKGAGENPRKSGETYAPPIASHIISSTL